MLDPVQKLWHLGFHIAQATRVDHESLLTILTIRRGLYANNSSNINVQINEETLECTMVAIGDGDDQSIKCIWCFNLEQQAKSALY